MAMTDQAKRPTPDEAAIRAHLALITQRWDELEEPCHLELRALCPNQTRTALWETFSPDQIDAATEWALKWNDRRRGIYAVMNPVRGSVQTRSAHDEDIAASFFHWADCDDQAAADKLSALATSRVNFVVLTGREPFQRPHGYWELTEPVTDLAAWTDRQAAIATALGSDRSVINPGRIMRLAGTVNWPSEKKARERGRVPERTTLHTFPSRDHVTPEQIAKAFGGAERRRQNDGFAFDTGPQGATSDRLAELLRGASTDGEKHVAVRDLAAHMAASGASVRLCEAVIKTHCPVWDENVESLIRSAYEKFRRHDRASTFDHAPDPDPDAGDWKIQSAAEFVAGFVSPEYILEGVMQRGRLYTLTAPTGSGKTGVMMLAGVKCALGEQLCGRETEHGDVLFLAGENPDDVRARLIATLETLDISPDKLRLHFIPGTLSIRADMEKLRQRASELPNLVMVVVDTLAAYFDGDDDNSNAQILDFARVVRQITTWREKPCVVMPAHPVKDVRKNNLVPRGGGALLNEVDGNLTLWNQDGVIELHWQGKHRGPDFEPLCFEMKGYETPQLQDKRGRLMPTVIAQEVMGMRASDIAARSLDTRMRLLESIESWPGATVRDHAAHAGIGKTRASQLITEMMTDPRWIARDGLEKRLTDQGVKALEDARKGVKTDA